MKTVTECSTPTSNPGIQSDDLQATALGRVMSKILNFLVTGWVFGLGIIQKGRHRGGEGGRYQK